MINQQKERMSCQKITENIIGHWRRFTSVLFKKMLDMFDQCLVPFITRKVIYYSLVLGQPLIAPKYNFSIKYFDIS